MSLWQWTRNCVSSSYCGTQPWIYYICDQITLSFAHTKHLFARPPSQPGHKSAGCSRFKYKHVAVSLTFSSPHTYWTCTGKWVWGCLEWKIINMWTHRGTICLWGHNSSYDPGLHRGHLDYYTDGWTHSQNTQTTRTRAYVHWERRYSYIQLVSKKYKNGCECRIS